MKRRICFTSHRTHVGSMTAESCRHSTSRVVHVVGECGLVDHARMAPHGFCRGMGWFGRWWCGFRGVGYPMSRSRGIRSRTADQANKLISHVQGLGADLSTSHVQGLLMEGRGAGLRNVSFDACVKNDIVSTWMWNSSANETQRMQNGLRK
jgi:hypothetical protein